MSAKAALLVLAITPFAVFAIPRPARGTVDPSRFPPPAVCLTPDAGNSLKPRVSLDANDNAVVVWQNDRYGNNEIFWQKFSLDGIAVTNVARLTQTTTSSVRPDISCGADTSYVVWQEGEALGVGDVHLARLNADGGRSRTDISEINLAGDPRVAALSGGYFDVVFGRRAAIDQDLYYRRRTPSGALLCQRRLNDGTIADVPKTPVVAVGGDANARLLWSDLGQFFSYYVLQGTVDYLCAPTASEICGVQGINPTMDLDGTRLARLYEYGGRIYEAGGCCPIAGIAGKSTLPATGTTPDTSYAVWQDTRDGNSEIYFCQYRGCTNLSGDLRLTQNAEASERPDIAVNHLTGEWVAVWQQVVGGNYEIYMTSSRLLGSAHEFLIPSATFDKRLYHNGTDVATVKVITQSITGNGPSLMLHATVTSNLQDSYDLGIDSFALIAGQQHVSTFSWAIPARTQTCDFTLHLELKSGGQVVAAVTLPSAASATNMTATEIDQKNADVTNDQCVPAVNDCASYWIGVIPIFSDVTSFTSFKNAACASGQDLSRGNYLRAMTDALQAALPAVEIALDAIPGPGTVAGTLLKSVDYLISCHGTWFPHSSAAGGTVSQAATDPNLDSLAVNVRSGLLSFGGDYAYQVFAQGNAAVRIGVDGNWTTGDSLALTQTFVYPTIGAATRWAYIGSQPVAVGGTGQNLHSECTVQFVAASAGPLAVRILDHALSDSLISYASIPMQANSVARLALTDTSTVFPLEVDLDGNGTTDFVYLPGQGVLDVPGRGTPEFGEPGILAVSPNPFSQGTTIYFRTGVAGPVRFQVYDVSGRKRAEIDGGIATPGIHAQRWNAQGEGGDPLPPGTYFVRLAAGRHRSAAKLALAR